MKQDLSGHKDGVKEKPIASAQNLFPCTQFSGINCAELARFRDTHVAFILLSVYLFIYFKETINFTIYYGHENIAF